ncbi:Alkaline phosphatase synthesis transcriptional regulatory protein PhoP [Stieleria maiorica]|uniref:Alkaline phosphatase synthesis transcriptional regulatory protein PhoP n=1 Tax=Stieleria maiorica TaxID=2795974 RepID=A0A5B9M6Q3_9BACT|nr:response regulator [Stieleria maiorica]QEF96343.1 Alkaline phosphatase synthesis transcriptional regulatory protein PhoP [Stieleria maiorica]
MTATKPTPGTAVCVGSRSTPSNRTILVADDSRTVLRLVERTLCEAGYQVALAADGRQAVNVAMEAKPDLIILDINMPVLDGYGVCHELLADKAWDGATPVIFLTSANAPHLETLGNQLGAFLSKPTEPERLLATVESLLARIA